jgi:hypothetical protein
MWMGAAFVWLIGLVVLAAIAVRHKPGIHAWFRSSTRGFPCPRAYDLQAGHGQSHGGIRSFRKREGIAFYRRYRRMYPKMCEVSTSPRGVWMA